MGLREHRGQHRSLFEVVNLGWWLSGTVRVGRRWPVLLRVGHHLGAPPVLLEGTGTGVVVVVHASDDADEVRQSRAMTGEWVTTGEAAEVLEVPMRELYRLIDRGEVPARRFGPTLEVFPWTHPRRLRLVEGYRPGL